MTPAAAGLAESMWALVALLIGRPELAQMAPLIPAIGLLLVVAVYLGGVAIEAPQREASHDPDRGSRGSNDGDLGGRYGDRPVDGTSAVSATDIGPAVSGIALVLVGLPLMWGPGLARRRSYRRAAR